MQAVLSVATLPLRGYLTELVLDQLSYYIRKDCLDADKLTLGGELVLHNLELKLDVLRETLGVPLTFDISRGFIRKLSVYIPWTNLLGQPIEVSFDTILIVLRSKTEAELKHTAAVTLDVTTEENPNEANGKVEGANGSRDEPAGQADGAPDGWTRAVLTKVLANASITVKDLIFKYEASSGPTVTATLRSFRCFSVNDDGQEEWCEPLGDERFIQKSAFVDDMSVNLARVEHGLGGNERPILSRTRISIRTKFALNPLPRGVIDFSDNGNNSWNPFGPHVHVDVYLPFCEVSISQTQLEMAQTIQQSALKLEQDLQQYVVEAKEKLASQLLIANILDSKVVDSDAAEKGKAAGLGIASPNRNRTARSGSTDKEGKDHPGTGPNEKTPGWTEWAWNIVLGEDEEVAEGKNRDSSNARSSSMAGELTNIDGKEFDINFEAKPSPSIIRHKRAGNEKVVTVINFCADHLALALLLQKEGTTSVNRTPRRASAFIKSMAIRPPMASKQPTFSYVTPGKPEFNTKKQKVQVPTPRGMVEVDLNSALESIQRQRQQRSYFVPVATFVASLLNVEARMSTVVKEQKKTTELFLEMGSFSVLDGDHNERSRPFVMCGTNALSAISEYRALKARTRSLSDNTPPPSPRLSRSRVKSKARLSHHKSNGTDSGLEGILSPPASSILALSDGKVSLYEEQTSIELGLGQVIVVMNPTIIGVLGEFAHECKGFESNYKMEKGMEEGNPANVAASEAERKPAQAASAQNRTNKTAGCGRERFSNGEKTDSKGGYVGTTMDEKAKSHNFISFVSMMSFSIVVEDERGDEVLHAAAMDIHVHQGRLNSSLMVQKIQVDTVPGVVLLLIEPPGIGINIIYVGIGIEAINADIGHVVVHAESSSINDVTKAIYANYSAYWPKKETEEMKEELYRGDHDGSVPTQSAREGSDSYESKAGNHAVVSKSPWYYPSVGTVEISTVMMHIYTMGVSAAPIEFAPVKLSNLRRSSQIMLEELQAHYFADALLSVPGVVGSVDALGNISGVVREIKEGLRALGEGRGQSAVKNVSGALLMPMERISRSIRKGAEGLSFGPTSGFVIAPVKNLAYFFEACASKGREVLGVTENLPKIIRPLKTMKEKLAGGRLV
jgi:hypothetical protein